MNTTYPGYVCTIFLIFPMYFFNVLYVVLLIDLKLNLQRCPVYSLVLYGIFTFSNDKHFEFQGLPLSTFSGWTFVMVSGSTAPHPQCLHAY